MSQIKISVPNDDHVALRAMAKALEEIAVARGAPSLSGVTIKPFSERMELLERGLNEETPESLAAKLASYDAEPDTTSQQYDSLNLDGRDIEKTGEMVQKVAPVVYDTDSTGTPWDERIHSASKALNSDGTWRVRRKPKDMDEGEWNEYMDSVLVEIKPAETLAGKDLEKMREELLNADEEPSVTPQGDDFRVDAGVVTEQEVASIPAPPLPPVPDFEASLQRVNEQHAAVLSSPKLDDTSYTFPQVMQFLTERHGRITSPEVDQIIADMGLTSIMDLNTQPEHTGPFIARVKAHLGE